MTQMPLDRHHSCARFFFFLGGCGWSRRRERDPEPFDRDRAAPADPFGDRKPVSGRAESRLVSSSGFRSYIIVITKLSEYIINWMRRRFSLSDLQDEFFGELEMELCAFFLLKYRQKQIDPCGWYKGHHFRATKRKKESSFFFLPPIKKMGENKGQIEIR